MTAITNYELAPMVRQITNEDLLPRSNSYSIPKTALTIAGHDPTGGAGITSDLKTFHRFGVYGLSVITVVTVQNTRGVTSTNPINAKLVEAQLDALASDIHVDAIKIGMLASEEMISCIASFLKDHYVPIVLDPIIASSNGVRFMNDNAIAALKRDLLSLADIITPNIPEASLLTGLPLDSNKKIIDAAKILIDMGAKNILVKGGHSDDNEMSSDLFYDGRDFEWLEEPRIAKQVHGTGCLLSAAIASLLAKGISAHESVIRSKSFITEMLKHTLALGAGQELFQHEYVESFDADFA